MHRRVGSVFNLCLSSKAGTSLNPFNPSQFISMKVLLTLSTQNNWFVCLFLELSVSSEYSHLLPIELPKKEH